MKFRMMFFTQFVSLLLVTSLQAAPITVPTSLSPGEQYRLAFASSGTRNATSSDINVYNAFVQSAADAVPELAALGANWKAIGSTTTVDARDNTDTNPASIGVPIFLLNDTSIASDNQSLWDGDLDNQLTVDENGVLLPGTAVWTGTTSTGVALASFQLGVNQPSIGTMARADSGWVLIGNTVQATELSLYAISSVLTVVPEPSSFVLLSLIGIGAIGGCPSRARRRQRT